AISARPIDVMARSVRWYRKTKKAERVWRRNLEAEVGPACRGAAGDRRGGAAYGRRAPRPAAQAGAASGLGSEGWVAFQFTSVRCVHGAARRPRHGVVQSASILHAHEARRPSAGGQDNVA